MNPARRWPWGSGTQAHKARGWLFSPRGPDFAVIVMSSQAGHALELEGLSVEGSGVRAVVVTLIFWP